MIYLDHNATTPVAPEVIDAITAVLTEGWGNPSSTHPVGLRARDALERARTQVAALIGAHGDEVVFTSGGTESDNIAILGVARAAPAGRHIVTSAVEHPAITAPCADLAAEGWRIDRLGVDETGRIDPVAARAVIRPDTTLVSVMLANNETGALQPVDHLTAPLLHTDAAQAVGKIPVDVDGLGVDLLTIAGHKLYAPKGIGALYVRRGTRVASVLRGGGQERGLSPGTENVAFAAGLGVACELAAATLATEGARQRQLTDRLWERLAARVGGLRRHGPSDARLPNTLNVGFPSVSGRELLAASGLSASTGSACHEGGAETPSAVLVAMGIAPEQALGAVRLSIGRGTRTEDVDAAADALIAAWSSMTRSGV